MKKVLLIAALLMPLGASAKIADFNAMIRENSAEQAKLHADVQAGMDQAHVALEASRDSNVIVEAKPDVQNIPTNGKLLRFKKEVVMHEASEKNNQKRLATEFKSADMEF